MRILFVSPWFPFPPTNGSELRINALVRGLAAVHEVTLVSFHRRPVSDADRRAAEGHVERLYLVPWREFNPDSGRARLGFLSRRPRSVMDTYAPAMAAAIRSARADGSHDIAVVAQLGAAAYADALGDLPAVLDEVELGTFHHQTKAGGSAAARLRRRLMWVKMSAWVRGLLPRFAAATVVSPGELALLQTVAPQYAPVEIIPNGIDMARYEGIEPPRKAATLIFTGAFTYDANYRAMVWFVGEVWPRIRAAMPRAQLVITGDHAGRILPDSDGITLTGFVDDVRPWIAAASVAVVPILEGGGTRLKVLEAMALRTPVVATSKGAEGLPVRDGEHLLLADTPEAFAAAVTSTLNDAAGREKRVNCACDLVRREYDWKVVMPRFVSLVEMAAALGTSVSGLHRPNGQQSGSQSRSS